MEEKQTINYFRQNSSFFHAESAAQASLGWRASRPSCSRAGMREKLCCPLFSSGGSSHGTSKVHGVALLCPGEVVGARGGLAGVARRARPDSAARVGALSAPGARTPRGQHCSERCGAHPQPSPRRMGALSLPSPALVSLFSRPSARFCSLTPVPQPHGRRCWRGEECRWRCVSRGGARCARLR